MARECRHCGLPLIDPNDKLSGQHYTDNELVRVQRFDMMPTKCGKGVLLTYELENGEVATEGPYWPASDNQVAVRMWRNKVLFPHIGDKTMVKRVIGMKNAGAICGMKAMFDSIGWITHRKNDKGKDIIHRKVKRGGDDVVESNDEQQGEMV